MRLRHSAISQYDDTRITILSVVRWATNIRSFFNAMRLLLLWNVYNDNRLKKETHNIITVYFSVIFYA
jgi:hypothetical protein